MIVMARFNVTLSGLELASDNDLAQLRFEIEKAVEAMHPNMDKWGHVDVELDLSAGEGNK